MATLADLMIEIGIDVDGVLKGALKVTRSIDKMNDGVKKSAMKAVDAVTSIGAATPVVAGLAGGVISLGVAFAGAGAAAGVFGAVAKSAMSEVSENATKVEDLTDKMELYNEQGRLAEKYGQSGEAFFKKQAKAALELDARLRLLPPATRDATWAFIDMKAGWKDFVDQNKPATFGIMTKGYKLISSSIGKLQPLFDAGASSAGRLIDKLQGWVANGGIERLAKTGAESLESLTTVIMNTGTALGNTFGKIGAKSGQGFLDWLVEITDRWVAWTEAPGENEGLNKLVGYMSQHGPTAVAALTSLAVAAVAIAKAVAPLAPLTAAVAGGLASIIAVLPPPVLTALVTAFIAFGLAMKAYAAYTAIATVVQWAMNAAWLANPITWIVLAIVALIALIVYLATKTKFFQTIWGAVWSFFKAIGAWFAGPFANFFVSLWNRLKAGFISAKNFVINVIKGIVAYYKWWWNQGKSAIAGIIATIGKVVAFIRAIPGKVRGALANIFSPMWQGFKSAINRIISGWNNLSFGIPGFSIGPVSFDGISVGTPNIPMLAAGGIATGPTLAMVGEGNEDEAIVPLSKLPELAGRGDTQVTVVIEGAETEFRRWLKKSIRVKGPVQPARAAA